MDGLGKDGLGGYVGGWVYEWLSERGSWREKLKESWRCMCVWCLGPRSRSIVLEKL